MIKDKPLLHIMEKRIEIPKSPTFHWLPKHLNHIAENMVFKKRNISFLAINKIFRQRETHFIKPSKLGNEHFEIEDFVESLPNDLLRYRAENLKLDVPVFLKCQAFLKLDLCAL